MRRFIEDRAASYAFDDVSEAERLEMEALIASDPELREAVAEFQSVRSGLRDLAIIPEHQLSNERLQEAILKGGLSPKKPSSIDWSFLCTAAVACCAIAGAVYLAKTNRTLEPRLVLNDPVEQSAIGHYFVDPSQRFDFHSESQAPALVQKSTSASAAGGVVARRAGLKVAALRTRRHKSAASRAFSRDLMAVNLESYDFSGSSTPSGSAEERSMAMDTAPPVRTAAASAAQTEARPEVLVIDSTPDQDTGAKTAKEVDHGGNLVVRG